MTNRTRIIGAAIALAAGTVQAANIEWDDGASDGLWNNPTNWVGDVLPASANKDIAYISTGATVNFTDGMTNIVGRNIIRGGSTLNITGGYLSGNHAGNTIRDIIGQTSGHSYVNQSGGLYQPQHVLRIGSGALGTVNLSGGELRITRGGSSLWGNPNNSLQIGNMGTLNVTNSVLGTRVGAEVQGGGTFHVHGAASTITIGTVGGTGDGDFYMQSNAVLKVGISTNGVSPITCANHASAAGLPEVILFAGAILDVGFVDGAMETNFWPVLDNSAGTFQNLGMVFDPGVDTNDWGFIVSNNVLYVGYGLGWPAGEEVTGPPPPQRDIYWTGAGGDTASDNPTNWVLDTAATIEATWGPYDSDLWRIGYASVTGVETGINYVVDYDGTAVFNGHRDLDVGNGAQGTLNMNSGDLSFTQVASSRQEFGTNADGDGTLNMNSGNLSLNATRFGVSGATGTLNLNGGTLNITRGYGDYSLWVGHGGGSVGTVNVTGGRVFTRTGVKLGDGTAIGIFGVEGSVATTIGIGSNNSLDGQWIQNSGSILKARMDDGGITPITIVNKDAGDAGKDGDVYFNTGSILDVDWMPGVTNYNSFDVMTWDGDLVESNLTFAPGVDTNIWSFTFVDDNMDGTNDTLRVSAYGETANGTPYSWLIDYGLTEADDDVDLDDDGLLTWEEYVAGTNPTNGTSTLVVTDAESLGGGDFVITWQSVEGKSYSIITNDNLIFPEPGVAVSGIIGQPDETSYTGTISGASSLFYEVGVE